MRRRSGATCSSAPVAGTSATRTPAASSRAATGAPHATALLTYAATVDTTQRSDLAVGDVLGDGSDPSRDHLLADDEVLTRVTLPPPAAGERAAYFRSISRFEAEWPLVEAVVRVLRDDGGTVTSCAVAIGGVAPTPLRLSAVEALITGTQLDDDAITAAAATATEGASPLPETGYKVQLVEATVREVLERVRSGKCSSCRTRTRRST